MTTEIEKVSLSYYEYMQKLADEFLAASGHESATTRELAIWAINNGRWEPPPDLMFRKCRDDFANALREQYIYDDTGLAVRAKHVARVIKGSQQQYLWADIRTAKRSHIARAFQQRREQVVGACRQLDRDKDYYNKNHPAEKPIQIVFDFRDDVEEGNFSGDYNPQKPR